MPTSLKEERLRWVAPIVSKEIKLKDVIKVCPYSKRSLERWVAAYKTGGADMLVPKSTRPKTSPKEKPIALKEQVFVLRQKTRLCAQKLSWRIAKQEVQLHPRTIGKWLKAEGLTRRYRTKKLTWKYIKVPLKAGELIEIDVKYVPGRVQGRRYYQFTAIDVASRWRYLAVYDSLGNHCALHFLQTLIRIAPFRIRTIKTDNGSNFTNRYTGYLLSSNPLHPRLHPFDLACERLGILHYLIDPGKPAQNGHVESSHRTDQLHFYNLTKHFTSKRSLLCKLRTWNIEYNNTEHCGLNGKTPNEVLLSLTH